MAADGDSVVRNGAVVRSVGGEESVRGFVEEAHESRLSGEGDGDEECRRTCLLADEDRESRDIVSRDAVADGDGRSRSSVVLLIVKAEGGRRMTRISAINDGIEGEAGDSEDLEAASSSTMELKTTTAVSRERRMGGCDRVEGRQCRPSQARTRRSKKKIS